MEYIELYHVFPGVVGDRYCFIRQLGRVAHGDSTDADCSGQYKSFLRAKKKKKSYNCKGPPRLLSSLVLEVPGIWSSVG
jgi:hypothetical protein